MFGGQANPLVMAAKTAKRLPKSYFAPAVIWIIFFISIVFQGLVYNLFPVRAEFVLGRAALQSVYLIVAFGFVLLMLWLWVRFYERRPLMTLGFNAKSIAAKMALGAFMGFLLITAAFGTAILLGAFTVSTAESPNFGMAALPAVLLALIGWMVQGSTEEIAFRGWMLPVISARANVTVGVLVSSAMFALLHMFNPGVTVLAIFNLVLFGLFTALYALHEGSIWGACALHAVWNWTGSNLFGTTISGGNAAFGLVSLAPTDASELLTGGAFGIEGSVITTIVLTIAIVVVWFLARRQAMQG